MAAQQQRMDAVANDVANVSTAGYKSVKLSFRDLAYRAVATGNGVREGAGAAVTEVGRSQAPSALRRTDEPLDVAITGSGYLQVRRPDGTVGLTRNGALHLDADRRLATGAGHLLEPPVTVPAGVDAGDVEIGPDGRVSSGGRRFGTIVVADVPAPRGLLPVGDGVLVPSQASGAPAPAADARLQQGALEGSNVDIGQAMGDLMEAQRAYSLASRAIQTQDQLLEIANGVKR